MNKLLASAFSLFALLAGSFIAQCQKPIADTSFDFIPREKVIFEDDFSKDSIGAFPAKWNINPMKDFNGGTRQNGEKDKRFLKVQKAGNDYELVIDVTAQPVIEPKLKATHYLPDSFTIEFDFLLNPENNSSVSLEFEFLNPYSHKHFCIMNTGNLHYWHPFGIPCTADKKYPIPFSYDLWHHYALSCNKRNIKWYVDHFRLASIPDCDFTPEQFYLFLCGPIEIRNFRLATGKENNEFRKLLTQQKFTTHAINFDFASSSIKQESISYIKQFARFLKANPTVKLEIDGHTDGDGNAAANMRLSHARAGEVKKHFIDFGIDSNRLSAKGFGATVTLKPNNTPEGKAENRRVEFIKQ